MHPHLSIVMFERFAELVAAKNPTSTSAAQVAEEMKALLKYMEEERIQTSLTKITTENLKNRKFKVKKI